jgi:hypothetical protein
MLASEGNPKFEYRNSKQILNPNFRMDGTVLMTNSLRFEHLDFGHSLLFRASCFGFRICLSSFFLKVLQQRLEDLRRDVFKLSVDGVFFRETQLMIKVR